MPTQSSDPTSTTSSPPIQLRVRIADNSKIKDEKFVMMDSSIIPSLDEFGKMAKSKLNLKKKIVAIYNGKTGQEVLDQNYFSNLISEFVQAKRNQLNSSGNLGTSSKPSNDLFFVFSTNEKQKFQGKVETSQAPTLQQPSQTEISNNTAMNTHQLPPEVTILIKDSWLDDGAIKQLQETARTLKGARRLVGEPDLHPGKTFPVGAVIATQHYIYPPLVGNDIGCGMSLYKTNLSSSTGVKQLEKWVKRLHGLERGGITGDETRPVLDIEKDLFEVSMTTTTRSIPFDLSSSDNDVHEDNNKSFSIDSQTHSSVVLLDDKHTSNFIERYLKYFQVDLGSLADVTPSLEELNQLEKEQAEDSKQQPSQSETSQHTHTYENKALEFALRQLGTVGGGNHFAELQIIEKVCNSKIFLQELGLTEDLCYLMVHSGSRSLGDHILGEHEKKFGNEGLLFDSPDAQYYLKHHDNACRWAQANRGLIARKFLSCLNGTGQQILDICHNNVVEKQIGDEKLFIHRKGAAPTDQGYFVIPGSRGSFSYLVRGREEDVTSQIRCNFSAAHGAGRKWKRSKSVGMSSNTKENIQSFTTTELGSKVICEDKTLLFEEQPAAYKDIDTVISDLEHFGVIEVIAILRPLITYKMRSCCYE
ncbi:hypothetical protein FDP41_003321 [Naegleria fowleri]|uniref:3'-phosphate/5'-hydroxy nucleic acid ligase n=1 Tax=Naegleria fowleri TaxID=5763 RepID=A0A6A5BWM9_NAEFO|nr:uncharacterized protein FDP41_003321 [Naegleria fowleri]KAF0977329.1 hypothetical protein FDP41_003321 [Naegleria fowleri]CAG4712479.1 unnamed protein product [Naegleria fowleri]